MPNDAKQITKLTERWGKADALWKKASKRSQEAIAAYHWTMQDDRAKWNMVLVLRMREAIAFRKAESAREALAEFIRHTRSSDIAEH